jgi:hypothetical protein
MPITRPTVYEFYTKKKKIHKYNKKSKGKLKPYGWKDLSLKDIEARIQSILNQYITSKNNKITWVKIKKDVQLYINYIWSKDRHGFSQIQDFTVIRCSFPETMCAEDIINNRLILGVLINLNSETPETQTYISFLQVQENKDQIDQTNFKVI